MKVFLIEDVKVEFFFSIEQDYMWSFFIHAVLHSTMFVYSIQTQESHIIPYFKHGVYPMGVAWSIWQWKYQASR